MPDCYQGNELRAPALVDPDNRRPVPFGELAARLRDVDSSGRTATSMARMLRTHGDGRVKLAVTSALLRFRRDHRALVAGGRYVPLEVTGPGAGHVVAFAQPRHPRAHW